MSLLPPPPKRQPVRGRVRNLSGLAAQAVALPWTARQAAIALCMQLDCGSGLSARLGAINYARGGDNGGSIDGQTGPVWQYWGQGVEHAPPLVRNCLASVEQNAAGRERILLSDKTLAHYLDVPGALMDRRDFWGWTKFSNLLRLMLLEKHGGTWVDATVLFGQPMPQWITASEFFVYQWDHDPRIVATWFIHSKSGHPLICAIRAAYQEYFLRARTPGDYFMFHHIIEALVLAHANIENKWSQVPFEPAQTPHELQWLLAEPFVDEVLREVMQRSWIQKLTYKIGSGVEMRGTFLAALCREGFSL